MKIRSLVAAWLVLALVTFAATSATPAPPQVHLAGLAGHWQVEQQLWTDPDAPPARDHGSAELAMVLGGRHLQQQLRIDSATPFEGLGYVGFDEAAGRYYASWMDTNFNGVLLLHGDADPDGGTYVLRGDMAMAGMPEQRIAVREVLHVIDPDHFTVEYFETREGREARMVALDYRRR